MRRSHILSRLQEADSHQTDSSAHRQEQAVGNDEENKKGACYAPLMVFTGLPANGSLTCQALSGCSRVGIPFDRFVLMILHFGFVLENLAVQFVDQGVNGGV